MSRPSRVFTALVCALCAFVLCFLTLRAFHPFSGDARQNSPARAAVEAGAASGREYSGDPRLSPPGPGAVETGAARRIEYVVASVGVARGWQLRLFSVDAGEPVAPCDEEGVSDTDPAWSPEGTRLSFVRLGPQVAIWVVRADGSDLRCVEGGDDVVVGPAAWSPDGHALAFTRLYPQGINTLDLRTGATQRLTDRNDFYADWSPDGSRVAFVRQTAGDEVAGDLWVCSPGGGDEEKLPIPTGPAMHPRWSPDGTRLAFAAAAGDQFDIFTAKVDGSDVSNLTNTGDMDEVWPDWSPDGGRLVFLRGRHETANQSAPPCGDLYICKSDGSDCKQFTHLDVPMSGIAWQPRGGGHSDQDGESN